MSHHHTPKDRVETLANKAADGANAAISNLEGKAADVAEGAKEYAANAKECASTYMDRMSSCVSAKPLQSAGIAFIAGIVASSFLSHRS